MAHDDEIRSLVEQACVDFERELRAFLLGVLKDGHLADDAYQKTVVKAIEACSAVNQDTIKGWLFKIALNEAREMKRVSKRQSRLNQAVSESANSFSWWQSSESVAQPLLAATKIEEKAIIEAALQRLDENYRDVVLRRIQKGQTFAEIAADLNRPLGTILTWMRRALLELKEMDELRRLSDFDK